jgi:RecB family exonuclease
VVTNSRSQLTTTRLAAYRRCPRQHLYRYELGLSRIREQAPLRLGAAFHSGLESHNRGADAETAIQRATADYEVLPDWADPLEWIIERETIHQLLAGHFWRYSQDDLVFVEVERAFDIPLVNPGTGATSRTFTLAGKIDGIVRLGDGRLAVLEYKTSGEDISADGEYWMRLRCDPQISQYVLAARAIGHDVATVLYDVTRKPTIRLRKNESVEEYSSRLLTDIGQRPDYYFARREVPRLEDELAEYQHELWQQANQLRDSQRCNRWFRNISKMTRGYCQFAPLCLHSVNVKADVPPPGFERLVDVHPELGDSL